jgi:hypothetical protein
MKYQKIEIPKGLIITKWNLLSHLLNLYMWRDKK